MFIYGHFGNVFSHKRLSKVSFLWTYSKCCWWQSDVDDGFKILMIESFCRRNSSLCWCFYVYDRSSTFKSFQQYIVKMLTGPRSWLAHDLDWSRCWLAHNILLRCWLAHGFDDSIIMLSQHCWRHLSLTIYLISINQHILVNNNFFINIDATVSTQLVTRIVIETTLATIRPRDLKIS